MNRLVVCAITVLAVSVAACSDDDPNGTQAGLNNPFSTVELVVDSSPVTLHVIRNPADTIPPSDTANYEPLPYYVADDAVDRLPTVVVLPSGDTVSNGLDNVDVAFSPDGIAELDGDGALIGDTLGTTVLTWTFTDYNHNRATTSVNIPVHVVLAADDNRVHFAPRPAALHAHFRKVH